MQVKDKHSFGLTILESFATKRCCADCGVPVFVVDHKAKRLLDRETKAAMSNVADWLIGDNKKLAKVRCNVCESI